MAKLTGKLGEWDLPHLHMWKDRRAEIQWDALGSREADRVLVRRTEQVPSDVSLNDTASCACL